MMHAIHHETGTTTRPGMPSPAQALPLTKLLGVAPTLRAALKRRRITTCGQLLRAAGRAEDRAKLAREAGLAPEALLALVRRADLARVNGAGQVFGLMLEALGVMDVAALAAQEPAFLHARLRRLNAEEGIARRSPTLEEVEDWVGQAQALPLLVDY